MNEAKNTTHEHLILFGDGGSRGNPGPSASGFVIYDADGNVVQEGGEFLGITTNNVAEYTSLIGGLTAALKHGAKSVDCFMDSQLVINQMNGLYKVKHPDMQALHAKVKDLLTRFESVSFGHVRREKNTAADAMVNKILDQHQ